MLGLTKGNPGALVAQSMTFDSSAYLLLGVVSWALYTLGGSFFPTWNAYRYMATTTFILRVNRDKAKYVMTSSLSNLPARKFCISLPMN